MTAALQPFFLPGNSPLYCCLHPGPAGARTGVLVVQPPFGEYIQHHRAFFVLGERLAKNGIPCLRYDHHGTGDSSGDLADTTVRRWVRNLEAMTERLVSMASVERIVIVGARLGATLALAAAARVARLVGLVLWEPVWSGGEFLEQLSRTHRRVLAAYLPTQISQHRGKSLAGLSHDVLGFEIPLPLWREIESFEPDVARIPPDLDLLVIGSPESVAGTERLYDYDRMLVRSVEYPSGWLDPENGMYDVLVPAETLSHVERWIAARP